MTLQDAIEHASKQLAGMKGRDHVALHVLIEAAKRVVKARPAVRQLSAALGLQEDSKAHLNQGSLFGPEEEP